MQESSKKNYEIRSARSEDAPELVDFQLRMARETEDLELDPQTVQRGVRAVFEDPARGRYWVADQGGKVIGCLLTIPEWSDWRNGWVLWIHSVYVVPEARRLGVYRALYGHLKAHVEASSDLRGLRLYVDKRNLPAQRVYESLGMTREHYHLYEWLEG